MSEPSPNQALSGRARGIIIGSLFAFGWAAYAASFARPLDRAMIMIVTAALTISLLAAGITMLRRARSLPRPTSAQASTVKRAWRWFWLNLVGEIVLLNIAVGLLDAPGRRIYWIPAISTVVGLHFWPMAIFFRTRSYWAVGAAMMIGAAVAAGLLAVYRLDAAIVVPTEALGNAAILWAALGSASIIALSPSSPAVDRP